MKDEIDYDLLNRIINSDLPYNEETDVRYNESKGWSTFMGTRNGELASHSLLPEKNDWTTFRGSRVSEEYNVHCFTYTEEYLEDITKGLFDYKGYMRDETRTRTILKSMNNCNKVKLLKR